MFDGDRMCHICNREIDGERNFSLSLSGHTHVFCVSCFKTRRKDIEKLLNEGGRD